MWRQLAVAPRATGAFTIWNRQTDADALVATDLVGIGVGRSGHPVRGSGVFVGGTPAVV